MKKVITAVITVVMAVSMVLAMTACGATPEEKLKSFIESETFQSQIDSYKSSFGSTLDVDVKADENKLIYEFTYKSQIEDDDVEVMKEQLDTTFEANAATYEDTANELKSELKIEDPVIVIQALNADGTTIYEKSFKATE